MRLRVSGQKEPILGYVPKNDKKGVLVHRGLNKTLLGRSYIYFLTSNVQFQTQTSYDRQPDNNGEEDCLVLWADDQYYYNDVQCSSYNAPLCEVPLTATTTN